LLLASRVFECMGITVSTILACLDSCNKQASKLRSALELRDSGNRPILLYVLSFLSIIDSCNADSCHQTAGATTRLVVAYCLALFRFARLPRATLTGTSTHLPHRQRLMASSTKAMLLLVLGLLLSTVPGTLAKKGKAETIDSKFQPGEGGVAERTGKLTSYVLHGSTPRLTDKLSICSPFTDTQHLCS
jgi:hypothetical protein